MKKLIFYFVVCILISACANTQAPSAISTTRAPGKHMGHLILNKGETNEVCFELEQGQKLDYSVKSSFPAMFNIHYHEDKQTHYPVAEQKVMQHSGTVGATVSSIYCLMWQGQLNTTMLEYEYLIH